MLKVLLVDDEPFILQGLKLLVDWENEGFRVAGTAANGMEALAFLKKEKVDLVIADIKMPRGQDWNCWNTSVKRKFQMPILLY